MAYWGQALVLGPNINAAMAPDDEPKALELVQKAQAAAGRVDAAGARLHRGAGKPLYRQGGGSASAPIARTPRRCADCQRRFPATSTRRRSLPSR